MAVKTSKKPAKRGRGRPVKGPHTNNVAFAASDALIEQVEEFMRATERATGISVSRSDAIRLLIQKGLAAAAALAQPQPELPLQEPTNKKS